MQLAPDIHTKEQESGSHSQLLNSIIKNFCLYFVPDGTVIYVSDSGGTQEHSDKALMQKFGMSAELHHKSPNVVIHSAEKDWLYIIEAVPIHGPIDANRMADLQKLFAGVSSHLIFVTALPSRHDFAEFATDIAWETIIWIHDEPSHLIHLGGSRLLGPYES